MKKTCILIVIGIGSFLTLYPVFFLLVGSFMNPAEISENLIPILNNEEGEFIDWSLLPLSPTLESYVEVLLEKPEFFVVFWNSVGIVVGIILGQILFGIPAAWGFARYEFKFKRILFFIYILLMMLPFQVIMLSEYIVLNNLNLLDTVWALILPGAFGTFPIFIIYNFFKGIPEDILDAARLDGASEFRVFIKIGLPLGKTGIVAALILYTLECWNMVEQPLVFLESKRLWPLTLYLPNITLENAGEAFVASIITLVPTMLIFFLTKDHLEKGIVASAIKE